MPKELTTEVVRGCFYTRILIGGLDRHTPSEITFITSLKNIPLHLFEYTQYTAN